MVVLDGPLRSGVLIFALFFMVKSDETCDIEIENTLRTLLSPQEYPSIQVQALRRNILRRFQEALEKTDEDDDMNYKRSLGSLAQWNDLPDKRNLEALARAGYFRTLPASEDEDPNNKRSIATLAKNGQLPVYQSDDDKRGIQSLARNGELQSRRDIQEFLDELYSKRNIGSLARNYNFPAYGKRFVGSLARSGDLHYAGKRNVAALARDGARFGGKRNVAALLRQDNYMNGGETGTPLSNDARTETPQANDKDKKNIGSIKAQYSGKYKRSARSKRQTTADFYEGDAEEYPSPVYQNQNVYDYEELVRALTGAYPNSEKRFLGRLPQMGKPRTTPPPKTRFH